MSKSYPTSKGPRHHSAGMLRSIKRVYDVNSNLLSTQLKNLYESFFSAAPAFSPSDIANLELWLDASDASTINFGVDPNISTWEDKSGKGNDANQVTASAQPDLVTAELNSLDTVDYAHGVNSMLVDYASGLNPTEFTLFILANVDLSASSSGTFSLMSSTFNGGFNINMGTSNNVARLAQADTTNTTLNPGYNFIVNNWYLITLRSTGASDTELKYQGIEVASNTFDVTYATDRGLYVGAYYVNTLSGSLEHGGDIAECIFYSSALSQGDQDSVVTYIQEKWLPKDTPSNISGLVCWLDANEGLTLDGSDVDQWADQSGNGHHATPVAVGEEPQYDATGLNGLPTIDFSSSSSGDGFTITEHTDFDSTSGYDFFVVMVLDSGFNTARTIMRNRSIAGLGTGPAGWFMEVDSPERYLNGVDDGSAYYSVISNSGDVMPEGIPIVFNYHTSFTAHDVEHSGVAQNVGANQTSGTVTSVTNSEDVHIGVAPDGNRHLDGKISEILIYNTQLSASDRNKITNYLKFKWGV